MKLSKVEAVGKAVGWEANGLALVMVASAKLKTEVAGAGALAVVETLEAVEVVEKLAVEVEVVERLAEVVVVVAECLAAPEEDGKVVMA